MKLETFPDRVVIFEDDSPPGQTPSCYLGAIYQLFIVLYTFLEDKDKDKDKDKTEPKREPLQKFTKRQIITNLLQKYEEDHDEEVLGYTLKKDPKVLRYVEKFKN